MDKAFILSGKWAKVSKATKSIYPSVKYFKDKNSTQVYVLQSKIAELSGVSLSTAKRGYKDLQSLPDVSHIDFDIGKRTVVNFNSEAFETIISINNSIVGSKTWASLSSAGKCLYIAIRAKCFHNCEARNIFLNLDDDESLEHEKSIGDSDYFMKNRTIDFCNLNRTELSKLAGINRRFFNDAYLDLIEHSLIADQSISKDFVFDLNYECCDVIEKYIFNQNFIVYV